MFPPLQIYSFKKSVTSWWLSAPVNRPNSVRSHSADRAVEGSEKMFSELIRLIQRRSFDVKQQVRSRQATEASRVKELQERLEQEITEPKRRGSWAEEAPYHDQFLQNGHSLSALRGATHSPSICVRPPRYFDKVTAAASDIREKLQDFLREKWTNISLTVTKMGVLPPQLENVTRADLFYIQVNSHWILI